MAGQSLNKNGTRNALVNFGSTAGAYAANQVIGTPQQIQNAVLDKGYTATLISAILLDLAGQKQPVDVFFFNALPTSQGADKTTFALNTTDAMALVGRYSFLAANYSTASSGGVSEATVGLLQVGLVGGNGNPVEPATPKPNNSTNNRHIWVLAVSRGTPTYGANGLYGRFSIAQD